MKNKLLFLLLFAGTAASAQQTLELVPPRESQQASVMQRIGVTDITVNYHSPLVKGRKIWGEVVPYDQVWRAGANENTTVEFSTDVTVEGQKLKAGKYGLHMIPTASEWTIIFSNNYYSWGSFFYKKEQDALRVSVKTGEIAHQEWLSYSFENPEDGAAVLTLRWEKLRVPVKIAVDLSQTVVEDFRRQMNGLPGFNPDARYDAAAYCLRNNLNKEEAMKWLESSIKANPTFANQMLKADMLAKEGKKAEADAMAKKALAVADENGVNAYGYRLLGEGKKAEAIAIFKDNVKRYPNSWNVYDSLAEALEGNGNTKEALANYKTARQKAPEDQHKRLDATIARLNGK